MINGSTAFNNAVDAGGYPYTARITLNGEVVDCIVSSCTIYKGSTGGDSFGVASIFTPYIEMEVMNLTTPLSNEEIKLEIGVILNDSDTEWITVGYFTVTKISGSVVKTNLIAVGRIISVLSRITVNTQTPVTCSVLISAIQNAVRSAGYTGFTINTNNITLPTSSFELNDVSATAQVFLGVLSSVIGGYITEDNAGNVVIFKYNLNNTLDYDGDRMTVHPVFDESDFELSDIKVIQREAYVVDEEETEPEISYVSGDNYEWVVLDPYITSEEMFDEFCVNCLGLMYRPATVELTYGDPRLEATDVLNITDAVGDSYVVPCMSLVHKMTGGLLTQIIAPYREEEESDEEGAQIGPITQQLNQIAVNIMSIAANTDIAKQSAEDAKDAADAAQTSANNAASAADRATELADAAQSSADTAQSAANDATVSANVALNHLGIVEDIVGVLDLLTKNGTYALTSDTEVVPDKWYFTRSGTGTSTDPYEYSVVINPEANPSEAGYYELTGIDEAIQNYVSSHLVLTDEGLFLQQSETATKLQLSTTEGVVLYGTDGHVVAKYGAETVIGDESGFHIKMGVNDQSGELGFYQGDNKVAYINNNKLYINQSVVVEQMDLGLSEADGGLGQWSWKLHENAQGKNNLNLKWIG